MSKKTKLTYPTALRFSHLRNVDVDGNIDSRGGLTVAYVQDVDQDGGPLVKAAIAFCHTNDNYSKHLGRVKSYGHLQQMNVRGFNPSEDTVAGERFYTRPGTVEDVIPDLLKELEDEHGYYRLRTPRPEKAVL